MTEKDVGISWKALKEESVDQKLMMLQNIRKAFAEKWDGKSGHDPAEYRKAWADMNTISNSIMAEVMADLKRDEKMGR